MKTTVYFDDFYNAFMSVRPENFSYSGLEQLYSYLEEYEDSTGCEMELDVIALCCDFSEDTIKYFLDFYSLNDLDELRDNTTVIEIPGTDRVIIQDY